ncbi:hypothetical protein [Paenibacillus sp. CECT 9249]|uniref:hypothetical protein n=1 Tax=Paenibacillus sp. CECT 9249 TaxID=2845385 RepID=UPI001E5D40C7|nr:hypothetical protein [Paenibacillus sp. CECT 9249]
MDQQRSKGFLYSSRNIKANEHVFGYFGEESNILMKQCEAAVGNTSYEMGKAYIEKYKQVANHARQSISFTGEQEQFYLQWCMDEVRRRVPGTPPSEASLRHPCRHPIFFNAITEK